MIKSFACRDTEKRFNDKRVRRFQSFERQARKRLMVLHAAPSLEGLMLNPGNKFHSLVGDRKTQYAISINQLARDLCVPPNRISEIVSGKRSITTDTALRLERYFGIKAQFWLNLQTEYDLRRMKRKIWPDWDSITLREMGIELVIRCENENFDWEVMTLSKKEVDKTTGRDSERDVAAAANALKAEMTGDLRLDTEPDV